MLSCQVHPEEFDTVGAFAAAAHTPMVAIKTGQFALVIASCGVNGRVTCSCACHTTRAICDSDRGASTCVWAEVIGAKVTNNIVRLLSGLMIRGRTTSFLVKDAKWHSCVGGGEGVVSSGNAQVGDIDGNHLGGGVLWRRSHRGVL